MKKLVMIGMTLISLYNAKSQTRIDELEFLLGDFEVTVMLPDEQGKWVQGGSGEAKFHPILDSTFIREELVLTFGQGHLTMSNSIGRDGRMNQLRMIAMDKEFATIDIYTGSMSSNQLVFDNLTSDIPAKTPSCSRSGLPSDVYHLGLWPDELGFEN